MKLPRIIAFVMAAGTLYAGIHWGSMTAGGADSYGYVSEAGLFLQRQLTIQEDIIRQSPWPNAADTWAPLGYRASPQRHDSIVPLYAPGLPMLMALAQLVGGFCAAFVVVPVCGALTVWLTFTFGQQLFGRSTVSLGGAGLVGTSPIFLYQLMNPMTDVPVTAAWTAALVLSVGGWPLAAGIASGIAMIVRPNLAATAVALLLWLVLTARTRRSPVLFLAGLTPFIVAIGVLNASLYESALVSGYGTLNELYAWAHWPANVSQFVSWTIGTQTPVVGLAALYLFAPALFPLSSVPHPRLLILAVGAAIKLSYLFYLPFDAWWYLRFLLPLWPIMMVLTAGAIAVILERVPHPLASLAFGAVMVLLAANGVRVAAARFAFEIGRAERRYIDVSRFINSHTDRNAVVLALQHSGTIRLYGGRLTLRFDQLDPGWFDRALEFLAANGRHPYVVLQRDEQPLFRSRFSGKAIDIVDAAPMAELNGGEVAVFDVLAQSTTTPLAIGAIASRRSGWRCDLPAVWPPPTRIE